MANNNLVDGLKISNMSIRGKCEDCILGWQTCCPFNGVTDKDLAPLDLVAFDLWGPSCVQSVGGKSYMMIIVDSGSSYKCGTYTSNKSDATTIAAFNVFWARAETITRRKIWWLRTDRAFDSTAWNEYCQKWNHTWIHCTILICSKWVSRVSNQNNHRWYTHLTMWLRSQPLLLGWGISLLHWYP